MISALHQSIKQWVKDQLKTDFEDVEIEFEMPSKSWVGALTRPTVNFFLHDLEEDIKMRNTTPMTVSDLGNNKARTKLPPRYVLFKYHVAVFSNDARDQNELLWRVLTLLMRYPEVPKAVLPEAVRKNPMAVRTRVIQPDDRAKGGDLWSALDLPPRPWLWYFMTIPLDMDISSDDPLILTQRIRFFEGLEPEKWDAGWQSQLHRLGGTVSDDHGQPIPGLHVWREGTATPPAVTNDIGRYELPYTVEGEVMLWVARDGESPKRVKLDANRRNNDIRFEATSTKSKSEKTITQTKKGD
jgi:hypothetical protein